MLKPARTGHGMRRILVSLALLTLAPAQAHSDTARDAYEDGAFLQAAARAEAEGGAAGHALAARALLAEVVIGDPADIDALIGRAEANARRALTQDADNTEARLQLAVAIGMKGRRATVAEAMRKGYAREGRALVQAALRDAPDEAWAHALEGGWNLEVVRRGGRVGAAYFGANVAAGRAAFDRARALAPDDALIAYQYAVALLELDAERYGADAARLLHVARTCRPTDAFEARVKAKAAQVAAALDDRGAEVAIQLATARFQ